MDDVLKTELADLAQRDLKLFLGPRPGKKSAKYLAGLRLTHCCTLLSEREGATGIERFAKKLGCAWVWLPIDGGRLDILRQTDLIGHFRSLMQAIGDEAEPRLYFHCSAGIHRTGFFVYVLLRLMGRTCTDALAELANLRAVTSKQVGDERIKLADELIIQIQAA